MELHYWDADNDPLHLFDSTNSCVINLNPEYDCTKDEILNEIMFEIIGNRADCVPMDTYQYTDAV